MQLLMYMIRHSLKNCLASVFLNGIQNDRHFEAIPARGTRAGGGGGGGGGGGAGRGGGMARGLQSSPSQIGNYVVFG